MKYFSERMCHFFFVQTLVQKPMDLGNLPTYLYKIQNYFIIAGNLSKKYISCALHCISA